VVNKEKLWRVAFFLAIAVFTMGAIALTTGQDKRYATVVADGVLVNGVTVVYSDSFYIAGESGYGIWTRATSVAGTPIVSYTVEFAPKDEAALFSELEGGSGTLGTADENPHNDILVGHAMNWARIRINGVAGNEADSLVDVVIGRQK
jgi:hypothetical protein